jgi:D-glycero-D-manno-heptose 1,7-bisphosphate phosphatase
MPKRDSLAGYALCIFDADDTLRRTTVPGQPCPRGAGEWELLPGVQQTLRAIAWNQSGQPKIGLASNQDQVGAGLLTAATARALLEALAYEAAGFTPPPGAIQLCPHVLGTPCDCRKPQPGMLHRIMAYYGIGPSGTVLVGDSDADRGAAKAAGIAFLPAARLFGWRQST